MVIVAAVGPTILTTAGMRLGWISSVVSVLAPLMAPEDRMVDWVTGTRFLAAIAFESLSGSAVRQLVVGRGSRHVPKGRRSRRPAKVSKFLYKPPDSGRRRFTHTATSSLSRWFRHDWRLVRANPANHNDGHGQDCNAHRHAPNAAPAFHCETHGFEDLTPHGDS